MRARRRVLDRVSIDRVQFSHLELLGDPTFSFVNNRHPFFFDLILASVAVWTEHLGGFDCLRFKIGLYGRNFVDVLGNLLDVPHLLL